MPLYMCQNVYNFQELASARDLTIFHKTLESRNCIHLLLPPVKESIVAELRPGGHKCISNLLESLS
jgi:hypothetical protein